MNATVICIGKHEFTRKDAKTAYVLELIDFERKCVYKAFTSKKHYDFIKVSELENIISADDLQSGYVSFENGFTKFYLPKGDVK